MLASCFFLLISSASAADFNVNDKTTHKDIINWMKNAKTGDNLIFSGSSYNLTNTINVNKGINIKSSKNTKINFNRNKVMFNVKTSNKVTFSGLTLNHNGRGKYIKPLSVISAPRNSINQINFNRVSINSDKDYIDGITIPHWIGSVSRSQININGHNSGGISSEEWKGNLVNSRVSVKGDDAVSVYSRHWSGKLSGSKVYNHGFYQSGRPIGVMLISAKGTISKCVVEVPNGAALRLDRNVKVGGSTLTSQKGTPKIYRFLPDLTLNLTKRSGNTYHIVVSNIDLGSSRSSHLGISIGKYVKTAKVKSLTSGESTTVKVTMPSKYISRTHIKTAKIDYYNRVRETNKENNIINFR
jgi:hypothetical protein